MLFISYLILSLKLFYPNSNYNYKKIGGYNYIKSELNDVMSYLQNIPNEVSHYKSQVGIILEGKTGVGKTYFGKCIASEYNCTVLSCSVPDLLNNDITINNLFKKLVDTDSKVLFLDELDILSYNSNPQIIVLNQLIDKIDGIEDLPNIMIVGTTRDISILNPVLIRAGRFDKHLKLGLPNEQERIEIISKYDFCNITTENMPFIVELTKKMTGAQIKMLINEVYRYNYKSENITLDNLQSIANYINNGQEDSKRKISEESFIKICYHEVGHAIIAIKCPNHPNPSRITVENLEDGVGGLTSFQDFSDSLYSQQFLIERISVLLAGRAAEEIMFSTEISTGAGSDIDIARKLATDMVSKFGFVNQKHKITSFISEKSKYYLDQEVENLLDKCYQASLNILKQDLPLLLRLTNLVRKEKTVSLEKILKNF